MTENTNHVCPVERSGRLDSGFRKFLQNPYKILQPYIKEGMTAVDIGCGPGFFTIPMADMVGKNGKVVAVDMQEGMLQKLEAKASENGLTDRIVLRQCSAESLGVQEKADFVLAFYVVHEIPDKENFFAETASFLAPQAALLFAEPPGHVSKGDFEKCLQYAKKAGFDVVKRPRILMSKTALLRLG